VKQNGASLQTNAKYVLIDEVEIRGGAHTTDGSGWKHDTIAYPN